MYRSIGSSESTGDTSPNSDLNGAPNRCRAVGELSSDISHLTCSDTSSRLRSIMVVVRLAECCLDHVSRASRRRSEVMGTNAQCSCLPVSVCPAGGMGESRLAGCRGSSTGVPDANAGTPAFATSLPAPWPEEAITLTAMPSPATKLVLSATCSAQKMLGAQRLSRCVLEMAGL
jgi:hypothetical protein